MISPIVFAHDLNTSFLPGGSLTLNFFKELSSHIGE